MPEVQDKNALQLEARVLTQKITSLDRAITSEQLLSNPDLLKIESWSGELTQLKQQRFKIRQNFNKIVEDERAQRLNALEDSLRSTRAWSTKHQELVKQLAEIAHDLDTEISQFSRESERTDFQRKLLLFRRAVAASLEAMSRVKIN